MPVETGVLTSADLTRLRGNVFNIAEWAEGDATTEVEMAAGFFVPSPAKALVDAARYKEPVAWATGLSVTDPLKTYTNGGYLYAPNPADLPFTTGATFAGDASKFYLLSTNVLQKRISAYTTGAETTTITGVATDELDTGVVTITPRLSSTNGRILLRGGVSVRSPSSAVRIDCVIGITRGLGGPGVGAGSSVSILPSGADVVDRIEVTVVDTGHTAGSPIDYYLQAAVSTSGEDIVFSNVSLTAEEIAI